MSYFNSNQGIISSLNSISSALLAGQSWTGSSELNGYSNALIVCKTDKSGILYADFSIDGSNWDSSLSFNVSSGFNEIHNLVKGPRYFRTRFNNNSPDNQSYLRLQTNFGQFNQLSSSLNSTINSDADATTSKSVIIGQTNNGAYKYVPVTSEGHLEVAVHGPRNPFGSIHVENLIPDFQAQAIYGLNNQLIVTTTGLGGSVSELNSQFILQTNTGVGGNATIQSRKRLRYRPGQGSVGRFSAIFSSGVPNSFQVVGLGHPGDGLYFGYSGQNFGVLHSRHGVREIQNLQVTTSASATGLASVTLNGTNYSIPLSNSANPYRTAYEISTGEYNGWSAASVGSGVVFLANSVGNKTGPFLFSGQATNAAGTFTEIASGEALVESWYPQSTWNIDKMDGTGPSAINLDPTKGNVYQISYQFLGYGTIAFQIESTSSDNNSNFETVHVVNYPNSNIIPNFKNPSFPFTASAYSFGSTSNLTVKTASFAGFVEGQKIHNGPQITFSKQSSVVSTSLVPVLTIRNKYTFRERANQSVINLLTIGLAAKNSNNSSPVELLLIKDANLGGNVNFINYSTNSCIAYDESATSLSYNQNEQLIYSIVVSENGQDTINLKELGIELQPGESMTLGARTFAGTAAYVLVSLNIREDQ